MRSRRLGRSGIEVAEVGLGCWAIGGPYEVVTGGNRVQMGWGSVDDAESIRAVHRALDLGANLFDTANVYGTGRSEDVLGRALQGRRERAVIVTKFGTVFDESQRLASYDDEPRMTREFVREALAASLRRLRTDYVDVYLLHAGSMALEDMPPLVDILEELVAEGRCRWYGWSTDDSERAAAFAEGEHCTAVEFRLNVMFDAPEMLALLEERDLGGLIKSPLGGSVLTGKIRSETTFPADDGRHGIDFSEGPRAERLQQVESLRGTLGSDGRTMAQGALAWILTRSEHVIPIPGFKSVAQVEDNLGAAGQRLDDEEMSAVEAALGRAPTRP